MKHLVVLTEHTYAGYCSTGANKDWAACLAVEMDDQNTSPPTMSEMTEVVYLSLHGPHGGTLIVEPPKKLAMKQARVHFTRMCRQKDGKVYTSVPFAPYLSAFGNPIGLPLTAPNSGGQTEQEGTSIPASKTETVPALAYQANIVKATTFEKLQLFLNDPGYGVTEKVNGERCLVVFDGHTLSAYNRKGKRMSVPPAGAHSLCKLGHPFVIDGERLTGDLAGHYVAFDLLEWKNDAATHFSYGARIVMLEHAMYQAGLFVSYRSTPTLSEARANSTVKTLSLLVAAAGADITHRVIADIQTASGEGIVVRRLEADYTESPLKFKFVADIDAFVMAINDGLAEGSLKLGVLRPEDQAVIEVANVRSGFTDTDIRAVRSMLERGERPVFTVTYLPIRTIDIKLVEPRSGLAFLRSDKEASECTTDQFGPEKATFIAKAQPSEGMKFR